MLTYRVRRADILDPFMRPVLRSTLTTQPNIWDVFMAAETFPVRMSKSIQFAIVFSCSTALTLLTNAYGLRSPLNFAWYFGVPVVIAAFCNVGLQHKFRMAVWLSAFSFLTIMLVGYAFGLGS